MIILKPLLNRILYCIPSTAYSLHLFYPLTLPETYPIFFITFQYFYPFIFYHYSCMLPIYRISFLIFDYWGLTQPLRFYPVSFINWPLIPKYIKTAPSNAIYVII
jgi:hypothetical protein